MVFQGKIKYDSDLKKFIAYRIINKSELQAHLNEAKKQESSVQEIRTRFQSYIDDERVIEE